MIYYEDTKILQEKLDELEVFCNVEDRILEEAQGDIKAQRFTAEKIPTEIY